MGRPRDEPRRAGITNAAERVGFTSGAPPAAALSP
jgi:hypothetical protein